MREIKFRAWRKDEQRMYSIGSLSFMTYSDGTPENRGCEGWWGDNHRDRFSLAEVVLMQYTGLKDKNGKEIYEGDIVVMKADSLNEEQTIEVKWRKEGFYEYFNGFADCEVIGNIYENPELLIPHNI